jgi:hypothetical protein
MRKRNRAQYEIGYIDIPMDYCDYTNVQKKDICNNIIDVLLYEIDKSLEPEINRITFLNDVLESSLISNEHLEQYEICACLKDIRTILNED